MPVVHKGGVLNYPAGTKSVHVQIVVPAGAGPSIAATANVQPLNKNVVVKSDGTKKDHVNVATNAAGTVTNRGPGDIDVTFR
jgi:hypothetical protein